MSAIDSVILVDDDALSIRLCEIIINNCKFTNALTSFLDARMALAYLHKQAYHHPIEMPQVIFLDINMPTLNGWQFLDAFTEFPKASIQKTDIYMLSSSLYQRDIDRAHSYDVVKRFLCKPISEEVLDEIRNDIL